ncbi:hypothetical protein QBC45DRAFT_447768 [Copromyces sp. CBS 386.78]|nr:hypothetical protein QBC45DRAFT_447768 [Copromyces sp. CBS 386.78]
MATSAVQVPASGPVGQPDIGCTPDHDKYLERESLPPGFPHRLYSDLVWDGNSLAETYDWNYRLTEEDINEIEAALRHFKSLNKPQSYITQSTFPLPNLHHTLRQVSNELHNGHGFKVVRGLPVTSHTREENIIIYAGVSSHVAPLRGRQDNAHNGQPADVVLAHIKDLSTTVSDKTKIGVPAYTTEKQVFHTDVGDTVALFCLGEAAEGGQSFLSSSWKVYNELAATRPDLVRTLAEPWVADESGKEGRKFSVRPLLHYLPPPSSPGPKPERLIIQYARRTFTGYWGLPRSADIPPITEAQAEALDALHFTAEKYAVGLDFKQGDIQFVNNLSIFHARAGFNRDDGERQRHLVRLWLRDPELAWETPEVLSERWERVYGGIRSASRGESVGTQGGGGY